MKHDWERFGEDWQHPLQRLRRCRNCRAVQEWVSEQNWGRVVGYSWYPKAGRCRPLYWARAGFKRQETRDGLYYVHQEQDGQSRQMWHACRTDIDESLRAYGFRTREEAKRYCEAWERGVRS